MEGKLEVRTRTGSKYRIDTVACTWKRLESTERSGRVRTIDGIFYRLDLEVGKPMTLLCPAIAEGALARAIITSDVTDIRIESNIE